MKELLKSSDGKVKKEEEEVDNRSSSSAGPVIMESFWSKYYITNPREWSLQRISSILLVISIFNYWLFGIKFLICVILGIIAFLFGISYKIYSQSIHRPVNDNVKIKMSHKFFKPNSEPKNNRNKLDMRLTGAAIIDECLHEMIDFILRDYVHDWYDLIGDDDEFIYELRKSIQETIVNLSSRVKEVDWIPYLTTHLVDDAASHLRLYRTALAKTRENPNVDLISSFFDLEATMEKNLCRDMASIDDSHLKDYLQGITEALLYLLLPPDTYSCSPVGSLSQDLLVNYVLVPVLNLVSDPDFVNQAIIWLCQGFPVTSDIFLSVIRSSTNDDEIFAAQDFFLAQTDELKNVLSSHAHEELKNSARQQLKAVAFMRKAIEKRLTQLKEGKRLQDDDDAVGEFQNYILTNMKYPNLTLEQIFKESVALSYFLDYMTSVGGNHYLLLYLNAEAWKASAEQQMTLLQQNNNKKKDQTQNIQAMLDCLRIAALNIYDQFLSEKASLRVKLPENVVKRFYIAAKNESISPYLFDEIQASLIETLELTEKFYPNFTRHKLYIKCLIEMDLLKTESISPYDAEGDGESSGDEENSDDILSLDDVDFDAQSLQGVQKNEAIDEFQFCRECLKMRREGQGLTPEDILFWEKSLLEKQFRLNAEIIETAISTEKGTQFGLYAIVVTRIEIYANLTLGQEKEWHIYRRYSDFYDFNNWIKQKWMRLNKLEFPSKHTFRTTDRKFLEMRMNALNKYLASIISMTSEPCYGESLRDTLLHFLEPGNYTIRKKHFAERIDDFVVNPLKQSVKSVTHAVKSVPESVFTGVSNTVDGFTKLFYSKNVASEHFSEALKVGSSINQNTETDNIPLRIILLLMDEVFDLKSKHQWLRRRIVAIIREILKAMYGDIVNRRIIDYVSYLTSPTKVSGYLRNLQRTLWPNGRKIGAVIPRDNDTKMRTRIAAKASLISTLSDEIKHLIGSETTRRGLLSVFELLQNPILNRRLVLVIFEGIIKTLYPDKPFSSIIQRLHYRSNRVGKSRPFLVPSTSRTNLQVSNTNSVLANLSPRGSRKRK